MILRSKFEKELKELNDGLVLMGNMCEDCITYATEALLTGENGMIEKAAEIEKESDVKQREIQSLCMRIILEQQPVARDLRIVSAALKMITDMERIADQGSDIAEITRHVDFSTNSYVKSISIMADDVIKMIGKAVSSFVERNKTLAEESIKMDDEVDFYFHKAKEDIVNMILSGGTGDKKIAEESLDILMVAKYFERIGDHTVNIAQAVLSMLDVK